jgi:hypothetical protein
LKSSTFIVTGPVTLCSVMFGWWNLGCWCLVCIYLESLWLLLSRY